MGAGTMDRLSTDNLIVARRTLIFVVSDRNATHLRQIQSAHERFDVDRDFCRIVACLCDTFH